MLTRSAHVDTFTRDHLPPIETWPPLTLPPGLEYPDRLNAAAVLLDGGLAAGPDRRAIVTPTATWTYGELSDHVNQLAGFLVGDAGLVPGARVLLLMPNNEWLFAAWLAVLKAGCVAVTSMPALRATELQTIDEIAHITYTLTDSRFAAEWIASGIGPGALIDEFTERFKAYPTEFDAVDTAADDVAILAFTSGSTGRPKATMHFHRDLLVIADTFAAKVLKASPDDLFVGSPPIGFTFGLGGLLIFPMRIAAGMLLLERGTPDILAPAISAYGATVLFTPRRQCLAMLTMADVDFSSLRRCVSAGEPLSAATWHAFHDRTGLKIIDGIGATEMLHIFIGSSGDDIRPGATGRVVPGYVARIIDDDGNEVPDGTIGRLAVRGPTGCRYLSDPRQSEYVQDGWNLTGDTYLRDVDGYYWYQARNDDMIISAGFNIAGPEVEMALLSHPDVLECAVIGAADDERTMIVHAFVVARPGTSPTVSELQAHCRRVIAPYKAPRVIDFIDALPRTTTGKVQRFRLRDRITPS